MTSPPLVTESGRIGRDRNHIGYPHHVNRPGGTSVWLLEYTVAGVAWIRTPESVIRVAPGDFFLYPPLVAQDYGMDDGVARWDHIWIAFAPRPHWHEWLRWPDHPGGVQRLHIPDRATRRRLVARLEHALRIFGGTHPRRRDFVMNVLEETLLVCDEWNPASQTARLDERIQRALAHLCHHAAERIALRDLARMAGISESRFAHLFKEEVGETPLQYLEQRRIETARERLLMTNKPVAQIAAEVGFANPFYFSRIYRRRMGHPPSAARQKA